MSKKAEREREREKGEKKERIESTATNRREISQLFPPLLITPNLLSPTLNGTYLVINGKLVTSRIKIGCQI